MATNFRFVFRGGYGSYSRQYAMLDAKGRGTTNTFDQFGRTVAVRLPHGETNWMKYDTFGRVSEAYDFKGQRRVVRYDGLGRVATNFWFAFGAGYPSNSTEYYYDVLGRLTNITERSGTDAGSTWASVGWRHRNRYYAALSRVSPEARGGGLGALLLALLSFAIPRSLRRQLAVALKASSVFLGGRGNLTEGNEANEGVINRRARAFLPSLSLPSAKSRVRETLGSGLNEN